MKIEIDKNEMEKFSTKFSEHLQKLKCIEECSEIIKELCKDLNPYHKVELNVMKKSLKEEISDCILMLFQMIQIYNFDITDIQLIIDFKIQRTKHRFNII